MGPDKSIPALLLRMESFEPFGALVAHWVMFGSSNHSARPKGGVLQVRPGSAIAQAAGLQRKGAEHQQSLQPLTPWCHCLQSYTKCMPQGNDMDIYIKSIVNTAYATRAIS